MIFDNLKKIAELKKMQDSFKKERVTIEQKGTIVEMNGNFEVENIGLNPQLEQLEQEETLKKCLNDAREEIQKRLAKSMMDSGIGL